MLLSTALVNHQELKVVPFLDLDLRIKKRGPPYQTDFLIKFTEEEEAKISELEEADK